VTAVINEDGIICHLLVDAACETEGIGQQVMDPAFLTQFLGKSLPLTMGTDVDAIAGATISSQAVVDALNLLSTQFDNTVNPSTIINQRSVVHEVYYVLSGEGENSGVKVLVGLDPNGVITTLRIDAEGENDGQGVLDPSFRSQFIGRSLPLELGTDVEAATGSAAESQVVVDTLNRLAD